MTTEEASAVIGVRGYQLAFKATGICGGKGVVMESQG